MSCDDTGVTISLTSLSHGAGCGCKLPAAALQPIVAGRYRDRFERTGRRWRFAGRHMVVDLVGDLGHHLLFDLEEDGS